MLLLLLVAVIPTLALSDDLQAMLSFTNDWYPKDTSWTPLTAGMCVLRGKFIFQQRGKCPASRKFFFQLHGK